MGLQDVLLAFLKFMLWFSGITVITYLLSRAIGMGKCYTCGKNCFPFNAFCREHTPEI